MFRVVASSLLAAWISMSAVVAVASDPPGTPLAPTVVAGDAKVTVTPVAGGGGAAESYQVTAVGTALTCTVITASAVSCDVTGLTNGVAYTFTVTATNISGTSAPSDPSAPATPTAPAPAPAIMLINGKLRFGGGGDAGTSFTYVDSVASNGLLEQPFYKSSNGKWYRLTFSTYGLDMALGSGIGGANWSGATVPVSGDFDSNGINSLRNLAVDVSGITLGTAPQAVAYGYGTLVVTGDVTLNGQSVGVSHTYLLGQNASFVKITTTITNRDPSPIANAMIWVGTRDDYVGTTDRPTRTRGNLVSGSFQAITSPSNSSNAIQITSGAEGVLFYSTTPSTATSINSCCSFGNAYNQSPTTALTQAGPSDGSYAAVLPVGDLGAGASKSIIWYYAAGTLADLASVGSEVAADAGGGSSSGGGAVGEPELPADPRLALDFRGVAGQPSEGAVVGVSGLSVPAGAVATVSLCAPEVKLFEEVSTGGAFDRAVALPAGLAPGSSTVVYQVLLPSGEVLALNVVVEIGDGGVITSVSENVVGLPSAGACGDISALADTGVRSSSLPWWAIITIFGGLMLIVYSRRAVKMAEAFDARLDENGYRTPWEILSTPIRVPGIDYSPGALGAAGSSQSLGEAIRGLDVALSLILASQIARLRTHA